VAATTPSVNNFHDDPLFPRIERAVAEILVHNKVAVSVDAWPYLSTCRGFEERGENHWGRYMGATHP